MTKEIMEIPSSFYYIIGVAIFMNLSSIGALIVFIYKVGMFVSDTKHGISDAKGSSIRAHKRIDIIEAKL